MTLNFFSAVGNLFGGRKKSATYSSNLMAYAKTEYRNDWEFAYNYMLTHDGRGPSYTNTRGIEQ
jgi:hypothetical protein